MRDVGFNKRDGLGPFSNPGLGLVSSLGSVSGLVPASCVRSGNPAGMNQPSDHYLFGAVCIEHLTAPGDGAQAEV